MISIITSIAFVIGKSSNDVLPKLAIFSLFFLRILPAVQQIYSNLANIKTYSPQLDAINNCLNSNRINDKKKLPN